MKLSSELIILTGNVGSGKTTLIKNLIQKFREKKIHFSGLVSPARIEGGKKLAFLCKIYPQKKKNF
jgi:nucleoside-triphosphatase THEP1